MKKEYYIKTGKLGIVFLLLFSFSSFGCSRYSNISYSNLKVLQEKTFKTAPGKNFTLKAASGDVYISTNDSPSIYVKILGNEEAKKNITFNFENTNEGVSVEAKSNHGWNLFNLFNGIRLKFEITLPKNYNASVSSSGGDIYLSSLNGEIVLKTSGGDVTVKNSTGKFKVSTSGGDVDLYNAKGDQNLSTSGGDIHSEGFEGNLDASTSGGDIYLKGSNGKIDAGTSGGEVKLIYSGKNFGINLRSSGGDVTAKLPADFNAHADLHTSGGSIDCGFKTMNVEKVSSSKLEGDLNSGGNTLYIRTSGGDITVRKN